MAPSNVPTLYTGPDLNKLNMTLETISFTFIIDYVSNNCAVCPRPISDAKQSIYISSTACGGQQ